MIPRPRCIYIEPKIDDTVHLYTVKVQESRSHRPARLRSYRKLYQHRLCEEIGLTNTKTSLRKKTLQCRRNPKQSRNIKVLRGHVHKNWRKEDPPVILPHRPRGKPSHTGVPMVHQCPAKIDWAKGWIDYMQLPIVLQSDDADKAIFATRVKGRKAVIRRMKVDERVPHQYRAYMDVFSDEE